MKRATNQITLQIQQITDRTKIENNRAEQKPTPPRISVHFMHRMYRNTGKFEMLSDFWWLFELAKAR